MKSKVFEDIVVSTNSKKIRYISRLYGAKVPFLRPQELAQDGSLDIDVFQRFELPGASGSDSYYGDLTHKINIYG